MSKMDISALFGNILDNAIEGTRKVEDPGNRHIRLYVNAKKGFLKILAENTFSGNAMMKTEDGWFRVNVLIPMPESDK